MSISDYSHTFFTFGLVYSTLLSIVLTVRGIWRWITPHPGRQNSTLGGTNSPFDSAESFGEYGEREVENALRNIGIPTLRNVFICQPSGRMTEIDLLALVGKTIMVIEVKAWVGKVTGGIPDKEWIQTKGNGVTKLMKNPLHQNDHHLRVIGAALPEARFTGIVVFGETEFPDGRPAGVADLPRLLQSVEETRHTEPDMPTTLAWGKLSSWSMLQNKREMHDALVAQIQDRALPTPESTSHSQDEFA